MGLLDDAIKEHLELKRLRGADPNEIARQEHEAFDPPGSEPVGGYDATHIADQEPVPAYESEPPAATPEPAAYEPPPAPTEPAAYEPPPEAPLPPATHTTAAELPSEPHHEAQPAADEPPPGDSFDMQPAPPVDAAIVHQPTAEYALEDLEALQVEPQREPPAEPAHPEPEPEPHPDDGDDEVLSAAEADEDVADEDVLDQTPEFLQETPEHDRLWFEQKPPRDFDF